jgi:sugar phosphate isomerase/epimerase
MPIPHFFLGVKTDPVEYRYSYEWLFRLMAEEGAPFAQLGTFFELYCLPDEYFLDLRQTAEDQGIRISSVFTSHRELGGFMRPETGWQAAARRNYERMIDVAALLGADAAGSSPGSILRDAMSFKDEAIQRYLSHMKELLQYAHHKGVGWLTIEPMSCLAEPPTLPSEITSMMEELEAFHQSHADSTARIGLCVDVAHGYADEHRQVIFYPEDLIGVSVPFISEIHLKNTDSTFDATFGFGPDDRARGIVDVPSVKAFLLERASELKVDNLVGYLEIGGPKTGRDYSDVKLEESLRQSLRYLAQVWPTGD